MKEPGKPSQADEQRRFPRHPLTGVGALVFEDDRILLVQRGHNPGYGKWSLPGGLVEVGESLERALQREVMEEAGLEVEVVDLAAVLDRVFRSDDGRVEYHYVLLDFLCRRRGPDKAPRPASDALACAFVPLADLERYPLTAGTLRVIRDVFAHRLEPGRIPIYRPGI